MKPRVSFWTLSEYMVPKISAQVPGIPRYSTETENRGVKVGPKPGQTIGHKSPNCEDYTNYIKSEAEPVLFMQNTEFASGLSLRNSQITSIREASDFRPPPLSRF